MSRDLDDLDAEAQEWEAIVAFRIVDEDNFEGVLLRVLAVVDGAEDDEDHDIPMIRIEIREAEGTRMYVVPWQHWEEHTRALRLLDVDDDQPEAP